MEVVARLIKLGMGWFLIIWKQATTLSRNPTADLGIFSSNRC